MPARTPAAALRGSIGFADDLHGAAVMAVPQPEEPVTPAVPDAPVTPAVPDPSIPGQPEEPATVPTPEEPPTPAVPEPGPKERGSPRDA